MKPIEILQVEDYEGDILLTTKVLLDTHLRKNLTIVKDGWEAVNFFNKTEYYCFTKTPELMFLDINPPKLSEDILNYYNNPVNGYVSKPIDEISFLMNISSIEDFWVALLFNSQKFD